MKHLKNLFIAAVLFMSATTLTNAQSKVAHINTTELVSSMPEMKVAEKELEALGQTYEKDYKSMVAEYQAKMKKYEGESATTTDEENQKRVVEVQTMQQNIQKFQQGSNQELQKKQAQLLKPITDKAKAAILKVAKAQGFQYVLDSAQGGGVIMADGKNLLADVKKELGY